MIADLLFKSQVEFSIADHFTWLRTINTILSGLAFGLIAMNFNRMKTWTNWKIVAVWWVYFMTFAGLFAGNMEIAFAPPTPTGVRTFYFTVVYLGTITIETIGLIEQIRARRHGLPRPGTGPDYT